MQRERRQHAGNRMQSLISGQIQVEELFENAAVEEENDDEFVFMEEQDEFDSGNFKPFLVLNSLDFASESENEGEDDEGEKDLDKEFTEQEVKKKKAKDFLLNLKKSQTVKPAPEKKKPERKQKVAPWNFGEHIPSDETEFGVRSVRKTTKNRSEMVESKLLEKQKKVIIHSLKIIINRER